MGLMQLLDSMRAEAISEQLTLEAARLELTEENANLKAEISELSVKLASSESEIQRLKELHATTLKAEELQEWEHDLTAKDKALHLKEEELERLAEDRVVKKLQKRLANKAAQVNQWRDNFSRLQMARRGESALLNSARAEIAMLNSRLQAYITLMGQKG